jgi:hypothetical protein
MVIKNYYGEDIENHDTYNTTGASIGLITPTSGASGLNGITGFGVQYQDKDKEGTTHNTVIGNVSIGNATGDEINRDETKVQETTKNTDTGAIDAYVEGGVLDLLTESGREDFVGNIGLAVKEMHDIVVTLENTLNNKGDDSRGLLQVNGEIKTNQENSDEIKDELIAAKTPDEVNKVIADQMMSENPNIKDVKFIYTTPDQAEALMKDGKAQGAGVTVDDNGVATVYVNSNLELPKNQYIGMIMEEFSHIRNYISGKDKGSGTETFGRETNDWYSNEYSDEIDLFTFTSDGQYHPLGDGETVIGNDSGYGSCVGGIWTSAGCKKSPTPTDCEKAKIGCTMGYVILAGVIVGTVWIVGGEIIGAVTAEKAAQMASKVDTQIILQDTKTATIEEVFDATLTKAKGSTFNYEAINKKTYEQVLKYFNKFKPGNVKATEDQYQGKLIKVSAGDIKIGDKIVRIVARSNSSEGRPTIEIQFSKNKIIKIRF